MQANAIKKLVETYSLEDLKNAENTFLEGETPKIQIEGADEGEQLTHVTAAIWIMEDMQQGNDFRTSLRNFMSKVRNSIS